MATRGISQRIKKPSGDVRIKVIDVAKSSDLAAKSGISASDARKLLEQTIRSIPEADLKNLRGGQITLVA